jgi:glycosyltransferase involved in cell wall biosynthesis
MPFFSIIIPTFNSKSSLEIALNSVLNQTFQDFEILIIDDGSTDGTDDLVLQYQDIRILYEKQRNSGGPANPRNKGIKLSKGEWICFLDSDDFWCSNKLEFCYNQINANVDLLFHDLYLVNKKNFWLRNKILKGRRLNSPVIKDLLINGNAIATSSVVVRRYIVEKIGGFDESSDVVAAEDFKLWLGVATLTDKFIYINNPLGYYLDLGSGISSKNMSSVYYFAIKDYLKLLEPKSVNKAISFVKYINAKYVLTFDISNSCIDDLIFCIRYSKTEFKLKSIYIFLNVIFKRSLKSFK